jgi:hypothetical protein
VAGANKNFISLWQDFSSLGILDLHLGQKNEE